MIHIIGVVTPILIMTGEGSTAFNLDTADQQYLLSAALIASGLLSLIQITRFRLFKTSKHLCANLQIQNLGFLLIMHLNF